MIMEIIKTYDAYHACQHGYISEYGIVMAVSKWKLDVYYLKCLNNQFCTIVTITCLTFSSACSYYNIAGQQRPLSGENRTERYMNMAGLVP